MKMFLITMRKSAIPYLVVLFVIAAPIGENMLSRMQFAIAQGQEELSQQPSTSGGGLSINRSSDSSINGPLSQDMVIAGSFGDDRIEGSNTSDIIIGLLGSDTLRGGNGDER